MIAMFALAITSHMEAQAAAPASGVASAGTHDTEVPAVAPDQDRLVRQRKARALRIAGEAMVCVGAAGTVTSIVMGYVISADSGDPRSRIFPYITVFPAATALEISGIPMIVIGGRRERQLTQVAVLPTMADEGFGVALLGRW